MKYMMARKQEKGIQNLYDLYKHYNEKIVFDIVYVPTGIDGDFSFGIQSELRKVTFSDASICVFDVEENPNFFDLYFMLDSGDKYIYEHFLHKTYEVNMHETLSNGIKEKELLDKAISQCKIFYAMLNPIFFLNMINDKKCIELLLEDGAVNINLDVFVLEIQII